MKTYKLKKLEIPDSWEDVEAFCDWYMENNMPIKLPNHPEVFLSDDATSVCLFRHGQFQVEIYLIYPDPKVPVHEHPDVDVIKMRLVNDTASTSETLTNGQSHGVGLRLEGEKKGFPLFAIQHWKKDLPTTVAARWKGRTVGPIQEALIKILYPKSLVLPGYADVTKTMGYLEELKNVANG
jgi:hypothetical protein